MCIVLCFFLTNCVSVENILKIKCLRFKIFWHIYLLIDVYNMWVHVCVCVLTFLLFSHRQTVTWQLWTGTSLLLLLGAIHMPFCNTQILNSIYKCCGPGGSPSWSRIWQSVHSYFKLFYLSAEPYCIAFPCAWSKLRRWSFHWIQSLY